MITASASVAHRLVPPDQPGSWQRQLQQAIRRLPQLLEELSLSAADFEQPPLADSHFPLLVPRAYLARMRRADPNDPLLLQVLPAAAELIDQAGFSTDPVADRAAESASGVLRKYSGRALLITTGACAIHCRYCFRRHFPYAEAAAAKNDWADSAAAIAADPSISEVILSGGDPLSLSTEKLRRLSDRLSPIAHLRRLRLHTRWPIVLPDRVDEPLGQWLQSLPWPVTMVVHANHPQEIDHQVASACQRLRDSGVQLLNQAVLLAGINDDADALQELSERLHEAGVIPYYLHLLDRVAGASHFLTSDRQGLVLIEELRRRLPGYLVPRLARETPGHHSKQVLA